MAFTCTLQLSRYSGDLCFQFPHVFWLVVALILFCTVIAPIPVFIIVISTRKFNVSSQYTHAVLGHTQNK